MDFDVKLFPELADPLERERAIVAYADISDSNARYTKTLTEEELDDRRREHFDNLYKLDQIEEEQAAAMEKFKARKAPVKAENSRLWIEIKTKQAEVKDVQLYGYFDDQARQVHYYDPAGDYAYSRPMTIEERSQIKLRNSRPNNTEVTNQ